MGAFVISYVPNVENVDNIDLLQKVNQVDNLTNVETVETVEVVEDVRKLPHPYFPLKKYNYQRGGDIHITPTTNMYQAVYIPDMDCELKGFHLCFTSYNIEDTYDIMIGSRYIVKGSHVKEMTEYRTLEVYEVVEAGTPIVINYYNNSGLEKHLLYEIITLVDEEVLNHESLLNWSFNWQDETLMVGEQDFCTLVINQPNYVNMESEIEEFILTITDLTTQLEIAQINNSGGVINSSYIEPEPDLQALGLLARVNVVGIVSIQKFAKSIHITFKNINNTGTVDPHPIQIGIYGVVVNNVIGGM